MGGVKIKPDFRRPSQTLSIYLLQVIAQTLAENFYRGLQIGRRQVGVAEQQSRARQALPANRARRDTSRVRGNGRVRRAVRIARDLCVAATPADACPRWNRPTSRRRVHACQARPATRRDAISTL